MMLLGILAAQRMIAAVVNLVTNGDFEQGGTAWSVLRVASAGAASPGTAGTDVTFANGSAVLNRTGNRFASSFGYVSQTLPSLQAGASYQVALDYSAPATPTRSVVVLGGQTFDFAVQGAAGHLVAIVVAGSANSGLDVNFQAAANGTGVTIDNIVVAQTPADFNYVTNGDFAQGGAGWQASYTDSEGNDGTAGTDLVSFLNGACQLKYGGDETASYNPRISRGLSVATVVGATYGVSFDLSWASGSAAGEACYVTMGGKRQALALTKGRVVLQVVATSASTSFTLSGSRYDGPLVVDNIVVTKL